MPDGFTMQTEAPAPPWPVPDPSVLRMNRRPPPELPLDVLGDRWAAFVRDAAEGAACPPDYVLSVLLPMASALIGNARWAHAWGDWQEPPHLWGCAVGDSGSSKSAAGDRLLGNVLPELEARMQVGFSDTLAQWRRAKEEADARDEIWRGEVKTAAKHGAAAPMPPPPAAPAPFSPRLRQTDITIEKVAALLSADGPAPKGLLVVRDELVGWIKGMTAYNEAGRTFWIEAYGGREYRVERQKTPDPIVVPRLVVAVWGSAQPEALTAFLRDADDGLLGRICWFWPDPVPFRRPKRCADAPWATEALDRLRLLAMPHGEPPQPAPVPLSDEAAEILVEFARDMEAKQREAAGLLRSAFGKARGLALRLSLVLEYLRWCAGPAGQAEPREVSAESLVSAAGLVGEYLMPMAERVLGDAAVPERLRNAATIARWIVKARPTEVHVRTVMREVRLPGFKTADEMHAACAELVDCGWLREPEGGGKQGRKREAYSINPRLSEMGA